MTIPGGPPGLDLASSPLARHAAVLQCVEQISCIGGAFFRLFFQGAQDERLEIGGDWPT